MKKVLTIYFSLLLTTVYLLPTFVLAQFNFGASAGDMASELNVEIVPTYPQPNSQVSIHLEMYTEDLNSANISYYQGGKLIKKGKGLKDFSFISAKAGSSSNISIQVDLSNGASFTRDLTISPASVNILWQADSYTPPFYQGKALFSPQGKVRLLALTSMAGSNLDYKWSINGQVIQNISGIGRNSATINGSILGKSLDIEVLATDPTTGTTAEGRMNLVPYDPQIIFYENSPLYGLIFEKAIIGSFNMTESEVNVVAAPFNTSATDLDRLNYNWKINSQATDSITGRSAIFRKPDDANAVSGSSNISLSIENPARPLQQGSGNFSIKFNNN